MGMASGAERGNGPDVMIDMNMTPLIDVMLVLIIMLIITIPIQNHSLNLNLPVASIQPIENLTSHELAIDFDGTFYWNGAQIDRRTLDAKLAQIGAMPHDSQPELHIKPNRLVDYQVVASVMATAQRDNITRVGLVGNEQFLQK
jgi:biopolymer transport protein ExbD